TFHKALPCVETIDHLLGDGPRVLRCGLKRREDRGLTFVLGLRPVEPGKPGTAADDVDTLTDLGDTELVRRKRLLVDLITGPFQPRPHVRPSRTLIMACE